ncbi:hypothetical protein [Allocoleopsis sp.]|uniref:hypothetical protein n=1 Tax=Allocoleopsis sp. TaxID=3088169 RepID=UPI002FD0AAA5
MSILKINDLQAAQTEGYISELTETEMTVCGGGLADVNVGDVTVKDVVKNVTVIDGDVTALNNLNVVAAVLGLAGAI